MSDFEQKRVEAERLLRSLGRSLGRDAVSLIEGGEGARKSGLPFEAEQAWEAAAEIVGRNQVDRYLELLADIQKYSAKSRRELRRPGRRNRFRSLVRLASFLPKGDEDRQQILRHASTLREGAMEPTVNNFIAVLVHKITAYDRKVSRRNPNIYRLGNLLRPVESIRARMGSKSDSSEPEDLRELQRLVLNGYEKTFGPAKSVLKKIDQWLESGKKLTLR